MKTPVIKSTYTYSLFRRFNSNRDVNKSHLGRLVAAIGTKDLLYLFPIVVNKQMEIIDGQHRLAAAQMLKKPVYYIVADEVTKADIAMVNNNRKQWSMRDYINFHEREGVDDYKKLNHLLNTYPLTVMTAVKLLKADTRRYWDKPTGHEGGGHDSNKIKAGLIKAEHFEQAKMVCEIAKSAHKQIAYIFRGDLLLDIKKYVLEHKVKREYAVSLLKSKAHLFPRNSNYYDLTATRLLKEVLTAA